MIERKDLIIAVHDVINDLMDHLKVKRLEDVDLGVNLWEVEENWSGIKAEKI